MPSKKVIDYYSLPFEVHFKSMDWHCYTAVYDPKKSSKTPIKPKHLQKVIAEIFDVTWRCNDPKPGMLDFILHGQLEEYIPDWLEKDPEEDLEMHFQVNEYFKPRFDGHVFRLGNSLDSEKFEEYEDSDNSAIFYKVTWAPDYLVLDADGSRVVVDAKGYELAEDNTRMRRKPLVTAHVDDDDMWNIVGIEDYDIDKVIEAWFKK